MILEGKGNREEKRREDRVRWVVLVSRKLEMGFWWGKRKQLRFISPHLLFFGA